MKFLVHVVFTIDAADMAAAVNTAKMRAEGGQYGWSGATIEKVSVRKAEELPEVARPEAPSHD